MHKQKKFRRLKGSIQTLAMEFVIEANNSDVVWECDDKMQEYAGGLALSPEIDIEGLEIDSFFLEDDMGVYCVLGRCVQCKLLVDFHTGIQAGVTDTFFQLVEWLQNYEFPSKLIIYGDYTHTLKYYIANLENRGIGREYCSVYEEDLVNAQND